MAPAMPGQTPTASSLVNGMIAQKQATGKQTPALPFSRNCVNRLEVQALASRANSRSASASSPRFSWTKAAQVRHAVEIDFTARQAIVIGDVMNDGDLHADAAPHVVETDLQRAVGADRDVHRPLRVDQGALQRKVKDFDCMFAIRQEQAGFRLEWDA